MFYQCPKCKKTWHYPIEKCPDCFSVLGKMESGKTKVIGVSKVNFPTILHPKIPYFVLLLEDERKNKWVQKSIKEYKIGDEFKAESKKDKNAVAIWRIKYDIPEGIEKVVEFLGDLKIDSKTKILVLPTIISPTHPYFRENTSPEFLENLIRYLLQKGGKEENIKVVGQSFTDIPIEASVQKSQLLEVCNLHQITPLDLAKGNFGKKEGFEITEEIFSANLVINLPILKVGKASATENLLKFIKKENYFGLKYLSSDEEIVRSFTDVLSAFASTSAKAASFAEVALASPKPSAKRGSATKAESVDKKATADKAKILTIGEAQAVQKSDGYITFLGLILAGFNSLNLDRVFAEITMVKDLPDCLKNVKLETIPVVGREVEELKCEVEKF